MKIDGDAKVIAAAFVKARQEMTSLVVKDGTGNYGKYLTLAAIVEATTEPLASNGLAIVQEASIDERGVCIETWLVHESGSTMQFSPLVMPVGDKRPQAVGSAITYGRRYALAAVCGLAPDDDDGQAAQDSTKPQQQKPATIEQKPQDARKPAQQGNVPTDSELAILGTWQNPQHAQEWAVKVGACRNEFEAKQSFKKIVDAHGGRLTQENVAAVYLAYLRHQHEKLGTEAAAA